MTLSVVRLSPLGSQLSFNSNVTRIENVADWEATSKKYRALRGDPDWDFLWFSSDTLKEWWDNALVSPSHYFSTLTCHGNTWMFFFLLYYYSIYILFWSTVFCSSLSSDSSFLTANSVISNIILCHHCYCSQ